MTTTFSQPDAAKRIAHANLRSGSWGGTDAVCMMSALVSGANSTDDCVTAGWPRWLADLNVSLFDADTGADDKDAARRQFAMDVALAVQTPRDTDKARDLFLIALLERSKFHDTAGVTQPVIDLLHRRIAGEDMRVEMKAAAADAYAAADAARVARAAYAAYAAYAAADAADTNAAAATDAARRAHAAAAVACPAAAAAAAVYAAARADLIAAIKAS